MHPRPCTCDRLTKGQPLAPGDCRACWTFWHVPRVNALFGGSGVARVGRSPPPPPCGRLGRDALAGEAAAAGLDPVRRWSLCTHPQQPLGPLVCGCRGCGRSCPGYEWPAGPAPVATRRLALPTRRDGSTFNGSYTILPDGRRVVAARVDWTGADVWVHELGPDLSVRRTTQLDLSHPAARGGREDPRFFFHDGRPHISFTGWDGGLGTSVLYARLRDDLTVEKVFAPQYARRVRPKEKNWPFFSHRGGLYAVYSIAPHRILRIDGDHAEDAYETLTDHEWIGGHLRGGASPYLIGDRYYHWFHGRWGEGGAGMYSTGVYTFEAEPPFRVLQLPPRPLLWPKPEDRSPRRAAEPAVVFVCGAVREGPNWRVSHGIEDRYVALHDWNAAAVEEHLRT